jgi:hypothetical protein
MLMFTRRLLTTAQLVPRLDTWIQWFIAANAASFFVLMVWFTTFNPLFVVMNVVTSLLILGTGVACARKRQRSAYFFVAAFSVLFLANVLSHMRNLGILPTNVFTSDGIQIGSALEMLLLSLVLADRFNTMRREKLDAQTLALQVQGDMLEKLKASEQMLEARVAERTAQLQSLNQQLEIISTTDALTGIANRRHFDTVLASEWNRAARQDQTLSLGLIDLDRFKDYNDHYGHQAGDECLRQVARVLTEKIARTGDLVAKNSCSSHRPQMRKVPIGWPCPSVRPCKRWPCPMRCRSLAASRSALGWQRTRPSAMKRPTCCCAWPTLGFTGPRPKVATASSATLRPPRPTRPSPPPDADHARRAPRSVTETPELQL